MSGCTARGATGDRTHYDAPQSSEGYILVQDVGMHKKIDNACTTFQSFKDVL